MIVLLITILQAPALQKRNSIKTNGIHAAKLKPDVSCTACNVTVVFRYRVKINFYTNNECYKCLQKLAR